MFRSLCQHLCVATLALVCGARPAHAGGFLVRHHGPGVAPGAEPVAAAEHAENVAGNLVAARQTRQAEPTPQHWQLEARAAEAAGELEAAAQAYRGQLEALPPGASAERTQAKADLARVEQQRRGRVADEPLSTHRAELDARWAPPPPVEIASSPQAVIPPAEAAKDDRIITKWYFWATLAAIAASAAAVTGIAIKAKQSDQPDALDRRGHVFGLGTPKLEF